MLFFPAWFDYYENQEGDGYAYYIGCRAAGQKQPGGASTDAGGESGISRFGVEEFMAQGVIAPYNIKRGSMRVRGLEILKMRGAKHQQNICMIRLTDEGVKVYPKEKLLEGF